MKLRSVEGSFQNLVYAPKGEVEGVLLHSNGQPLQVVIDKHDAAAAQAFDGIAAGQSVTVRVSPQGPSPKGEGEHPVFAYAALESIDGRKPSRRKPSSGPAYRGTVVRLNHARHGAPNGVVLDSGDFIHTKPEGMVKLGLKVGDTVEADGDAHRLADDKGWAVDATRVNGRTLNGH